MCLNLISVCCGAFLWHYLHDLCNLSSFEEIETLTELDQVTWILNTLWVASFPTCLSFCWGTSDRNIYAQGGLQAWFELMHVFFFICFFGLHVLRFVVRRKMRSSGPGGLPCWCRVSNYDHNRIFVVINNDFFGISFDYLFFLSGFGEIEGPVVRIEEARCSTRSTSILVSSERK